MSACMKTANIFSEDCGNCDRGGSWGLNTKSVLKGYAHPQWARCWCFFQLDVE